MADLGIGPGPPLFWVQIFRFFYCFTLFAKIIADTINRKQETEFTVKKKKSQKEEKPGRQAKQNCPPLLSVRAGSTTGRGGG